MAAVSTLFTRWERGRLSTSEREPRLRPLRILHDRPHSQLLQDALALSNDVRLDLAEQLMSSLPADASGWPSWSAAYAETLGT